MIIFISILYFFFPIFSTPLVLLSLLIDKNLKHKKIYVCLLAISVAILLYYFIPDSSKDLFRYYIIMTKNSALSLKDFLGTLFKGTEPLSNIYFYIISKTGNNNLIMVTTTLISYGLIFYVIFDHQKNIKISNLDFNMIILFTFSIFYLVDDITGIRFCLARLLLFITLYFDFFKNKKGFLILILYFSSILIHTSCIIFVLARLFLQLFKNKFGLLQFFIILLLTLSPQIIITASSYLSGISFLSSLSLKANEYMNLNAGFYPMFVLQIIIGFLIMIILIYSKSRKISNSQYINYILIILAIGLLMVTKTSISTRFIRAGIIFSLPVLMDYIKFLKPKNIILFDIILIVICCVSILIQYSHLTVLISYGDLFETGIFKNLILIFFK